MFTYSISSRFQKYNSTKVNDLVQDVVPLLVLLQSSVRGLYQSNCHVQILEEVQKLNNYKATDISQ